MASAGVQVHGDGSWDPVGAPARRGPTVAEYFAAFSPAPRWEELVRWPPDVFALCNLVLDHTEAYRFAVAPLPGRRWPPCEDWNDRVVAAARAWTETAAAPGSDPPSAVFAEWQAVAGSLDRPLGALRSGEDQRLCDALLTLHAMSDEACRGLAALEITAGSFERKALDLLSRWGSLSRIDPTRVRIVPKTHFATRGFTIRSLSRYLALTYEAVDVRWRRIELRPAATADRRHFNLVLLPWPLKVEAGAFRPVEGPIEMDRSAFGFFEFDPRARLDLDRLAGTLAAAQRTARRIDAVVLPEAAVTPAEVPGIESLLDRAAVSFLIAGVRQGAAGDRLGRNYVHLGVRTDAGWEHFEQAKHHRWCLDEPQIRQYHLSRTLTPRRQWWEGIDLSVRTVEILDIGGGAITAPLICEDLARLDEVADVLRRIGPSLVIALLLDGPQLRQRWPCRFASVLADEPGSAVLTLSSLGMVSRSRPAGKPASRAVAMWSDPGSGFHQLDLAPGATGLLITTTVGSKTVWTADGRRHNGNTPLPLLSGVYQLRG